MTFLKLGKNKIMSYSTNRVVATPAGKCPVKLESTKKEDVIDWAEEIYSIGLANNIHYLPSCFKFFAQQFFNVFSQEYKDVCNIISSSYNTGETEFRELINKLSLEKRILDKEKADRKQKQILEDREKIKIKKEIKQEEAKQAQEIKQEIKQEEKKKKIIIRRK